MLTRNCAAAQAINSGAGEHGGSLLRIGRAGTSHAEWVFEAIQELVEGGAAERIGVWLEEPGAGEAAGGRPATLRGEVWEEGVGNGVLEWTQLIVDTPLRIATLKAGLSCEYEIDRAEAGMTIGPELELRRVLWVPVMARKTLRGLVMEGSPDKKRALPRAQAERVAEELEVLLELEEERRLGGARKADLDFWLRIKRLLSDGQSPNMILGQLAESCTRGEAMGGAGAVFALIGERKAGLSLSLPRCTTNESADHLVVRAQSGDATWAYGVNGGPLESLWRQAIENRRAATAEADSLPMAKDLARIVAIPVEFGNEFAAVLVAGLPKRKARLEMLDRLEWRGELASEVFEQEQRTRARLHDQLWQKSFLESSEEPAILVDRSGWILGISRGAQKLLQGEHDLFVSNHKSTRFAELFLPRHWEEVQNWLEDGPGKTKSGKQEQLEVVLCGGSEVRLKRMVVCGQEFCAVAMERNERQEVRPKLGHTENPASLGQRVTRILHELNNPLTTILGNAQRMAQRENGNGGSGEAWQIVQEAERAAGIVRQLLEFPQETGRGMDWVSLNELVESTLELQRATLNGIRVRLKMEIDEALPRVRGDQGQLQQVLLNLLQNAQQAMQESGKGSSLTVRTLRAGPERVRLEVQDDGPGIPEALRARVFDPFFTTKPPGKGTGLGLAIVNGFVQRHGGTIELHSPPTGGARFVVELPVEKELPLEGNREERVEEGKVAALPPEFSVDGSSSLSNALQVPRILVLEDEPTVAALIGDVLREEGMEVDVLPDGGKALERTQQVSYDLVICDVRMPRMDGRDFFEALERANSPLREHILFVTGDGVTPRTQGFLARNHLPYLAKPFRVEELCLAVRSLLWGQTASRVAEG